MAGKRSSSLLKTYKSESRGHRTFCQDLETICQMCSHNSN